MREIISEYWLKVVVLALAIAASVWGVRSCGPRVPKGEAPPNMSFKMLDGSPEVSLRSLRGKPVVLDFWESWCGPCQHSMPFIDKLAEKYQDKVVFIAVNAGDEDLLAQTTLKDRLHLTLPIATNGRAAAGAFEISGLPSIVVLDKHGKLVESFASGYPAARVESMLMSMLPK